MNNYIRNISGILILTISASVYAGSINNVSKVESRIGHETIKDERNFYYHYCIQRNGNSDKAKVFCECISDIKESRLIYCINNYRHRFANEQTLLNQCSAFANQDRAEDNYTCNQLVAKSDTQ